MAAEKGPLLRLEVETSPGSGVYELLLGLRTKSYTLNNNPIDVTTDDDINASGVSNRAYLPGIFEFSANGTGYAKDPTADFRVKDDTMRGTIRNYRLIRLGFDVLAGPMFIASYGASASYDDAITFDVSLRNASALTLTQL